MKAPHKIDPSRLAVVESIASSLHAEGRALQDKFLKLRDKKGDLNRLIRQQTDQLSRPNDVINASSTADAVKKLDAAVSKVDREIDEAAALRDQKFEKWKAADRLKLRCADFLKEPSSRSPSGGQRSQAGDRSRWADRPKATIEAAHVPKLPGAIPAAQASAGDATRPAEGESRTRSDSHGQTAMHNDGARSQREGDFFGDRREAEDER